jgi:transcription elongation factor Elf1
LKKQLAEHLLHISNKCPECKKGKMELVCDVWEDGESVYYIKCKLCGYSYDG